MSAPEGNPYWISQTHRARGLLVRAVDGTGLSPRDVTSAYRRAMPRLLRNRIECLTRSDGYDTASEVMRLNHHARGRWSGLAFKQRCPRRGYWLVGAFCLLGVLTSPLPVRIVSWADDES
jgi:hypothetical protein